MKIIVGLGNLGKKYENTRHNVGFLAVDKALDYINKYSHKNSSFKHEKKFEAEIAETLIKWDDFENGTFTMRGVDLVLVKPQTFMNLSGKAIKKIVDFYKIKSSEDLIVIHDDIDLEFGKVKIKNNGSSAGHNGVQSIIDNLGTQNFIRVRIGIGRPENDKIAVEDWVLMKLSDKEIIELDKVFDELINKGMTYLSM